MSEEIVLGITLKADGSGLVGEVRLSDRELQKLNDTTKGSAREMTSLSRASDYAREKLSGLRNQGRELYNTFFSLKGLIATIGVGAIAKQFIDAASTAEQYRVRLKILLGDISEGNRLFQEMSKFASRVPFEYREIMASATALAGVLKGGVDEINAWMPLIGDLAAAAGLGIRETTDQVIRMLSAGAASADLFRERGILAMLGFQAGVTYSGRETRDQLIAAWTDVSSKFRDATDELADTWDGKMSMLSDKWFAFRNQVMDAGLFDYLKAVAGTFDKDVGQAMDDNKDKAKQWSDVAILGIESVIKAVDLLLEAWNKVLIGVKTLQLGFETLKFSANAALANVSEKMDNDALNTAMNFSPMGATWRLARKAFSGTDTESLKNNSADSAVRMQELQAELNDLINAPDNFNADNKILEIRNALADAATNAKAASDNTEDLQAKVDALNNSAVDKNELTKEELELLDEILEQGDKVAKQQRKDMQARKEALKNNVLTLSESLLSETELENRRHQQSLQMLERAEEQKLDTILSYSELRQRLESDHQTKLQAIRDKATESQREQLQREAERQSELMAEPYKNALRGIQSSFTDFYDNVFRGGVNSFKDLASSVKDIFIRMLAEIASQRTMSALLGGTGLFGAGTAAAGVTGLSAGGSTSSALVGGGGGGFSLLSSAGSLLGGLSSPGLASGAFSLASKLGFSANASSFIASGAGFLPAGALGGIGASLLGLGSGNFIQDTIAGGAGSFIGGGLGGSLLTGLGAAGGPIGAIAGGFLGTALGGLFGGDEDFPYTKATIRIRNGGARVAGVNTLDGGDSAGTRRMAQVVADRVEQMLEAYGITNVPGLKTLNIGYASGRSEALGSGFYGGVGGSFAKGATFTGLKSAEDAIRKTLEYAQSKIEKFLMKEIEAEQRLQSIAQAANDLLGLDSLRGFRDSLTVSDLSPLSLQDRFSEQRSRFDDIYQRALNGDIEAINTLPGAAQQTLASGRGLYASGSEYQNLFTDVNNRLNTIISSGEKQIASFDIESSIAVRESSQDQIRVLEREFKATRAELEKLRRQLGRSVAA